jgi:transcription elongation factor Elf1
MFGNPAVCHLQVEEVAVAPAGVFEIVQGVEMSKEAMRAEADRLIKEAIEKKTVTVKQGETRIDATCGKCGGKNRVSAAPGQLRVPFTCKECGHKQATL